MLCICNIAHPLQNVSTACGNALKATPLMLRFAGLCAHCQILKKARCAHALFASLRCFAPRHVDMCCVANSHCARLTAHLAAQPAIAVASEQRAQSCVVGRHKRLRVGVWHRGHGPMTAAVHVRFAHLSAVSTLCTQSSPLCPAMCSPSTWSLSCVSIMRSHDHGGV